MDLEKLQKGGLILNKLRNLEEELAIFKRYYRNEPFVTEILLLYNVRARIPKSLYHVIIPICIEEYEKQIKQAKDEIKLI